MEQQYVIILTALFSFGCAALLGKVLIPLLRRRHFGQTISEYVSQWHKAKQDTPTMGGFLFILPTVLLTLAVLFLMAALGNPVTTSEMQRLIVSILMILAFTAVGFLDDFVKVAKKRNLGLTSLQKTVLQMLIAGAYLFTLYLLGERQTSLQIPFSEFSIPLGPFYYPVMLIAIYGFVNAVNLTDGIDGLCGSVTLVVAAFFVLVTVPFGEPAFTVFAAALAGGLLGFLVWNLHPAKVFMGDTGSMFLGASFVALCFAVRMPLLLFPVGLIYFIEAISVVIQVTYYKITHGKRLFKMTPIHHHYQISGWSENKIVAVFSGITLVMCTATAVWIFFLLR